MLRIDTQRAVWPEEDHTATAWIGVLRDDGRPVATCGHPHRQRVTLTVPVDGALDCITTAVRTARDPRLLDREFAALLAAGDVADPPYGTPGHRGADQVRDEAAGRVALIAEAAAALAPVIGGREVYGPEGFLAVPPATPSVPCHECGVRARRGPLAAGRRRLDRLDAHARCTPPGPYARSCVGPHTGRDPEPAAGPDLRPGSSAGVGAVR